MKTKKRLAVMLLMGGLFTMNGQTSVQTSSLTSYGLNAGTGGQGTYYGTSAGKVSVGSSNTFIGTEAGKVSVGGGTNVYVGHRSGYKADASYNVFLGSGSGFNTTTGMNNTFVGTYSGFYNGTGYRNIALGYYSGFASGSDNIAIGNNSGNITNGSNNIFIGHNVGTSASESNKLMIDMASTPTPLIWGDFQNDLVKLNAKVGIGGVTTFPATVGGVDINTYRLFVNGGVLATEVRVATNWADYVFEDSYALPTLNEVECFINENGHLPNVPSAKQVAEEGISVGEMAKIQQEKIEELTLYVIEQDKQLKAQQAELNELKALVQGLIEKK